MPELRAFNPVSTALDRTKKLLFEPFDAWVWLKLVIIMFFVGSGGRSFNPGNALQYMTGGEDGNFSGDVLANGISSIMSDTALLAFIALILVAIIVLVLIFSYLRGVFSFILIDALTSGQISLIRSFRENLGRGFKAFLFNVAVMLVSLTMALLMLIVLLLTIFWLIGAGDSNATRAGLVLLAVGILLITIVAFIVFSLIVGLITGFFYDFAIPLIRFRNMGLMESIKHVIGLVAKEPVEFIVYVAVRWALEAVVGFIFGIIYLCIFAVFLAVGVILAMMAVAAAEISVWLLVPFGLVFVVGFALLIAIMALLSMPVGVYFRYYSLEFLKAFDQSYVQYTGRFA
ncbi:DUF7544 domain-containing protein [Methanocella sp. MCL-LM]|uniref:DUF7544 domain-containing protein n=1 Tax=Methanocella sp. MCL-LM TaxID=3412035 RepID=UPI003C78C19B